MLKYIISLFIIFTIAIRPVLPLINYAVNYDYIAQNLCENKARPEMSCNGKCYVSKQLAKSTQEQTIGNGQKITIPSLDSFIVAEDFKLSVSSIHVTAAKSISTFCADFYYPVLYTAIFHPPLV